MRFAVIDLVVNNVALPQGSGAVGQGNAGRIVLAVATPRSTPSNELEGLGFPAEPTLSHDSMHDLRAPSPGNSRCLRC